MLRTIGRLSPTFIFPLFHNRSENDNDYVNTKKLKSPETGWERVKNMYTRNEFDETSVELHTVVQSALCGAFFGACLGGFAKSRDAYLYFIENNQATIFKSTRDAQKKLQDHVLVAFAKGATTWGWRVACFTGFFSLIATTVSVYRGNTSLVEYVAAGTLTGAAFRCNLGLAATCVGAGLGATLSLVGGSMILALLKVTGISMTDIRKALHKIKEAREDQYKQAQAQACEVKSDPLTKHHDSIVEIKGEKQITDI